MHLRRQRPVTVPRPLIPDGPPPGVATRACADDALDLLARSGEQAGDEARTRAADALTRDNLWAHARWRQAERLIHAMGRVSAAAERH